MCRFDRDGHAVILGDTLDELDRIPNGCVDLIFADPPYNIGKNFNGSKDKWESAERYLEWCRSWIDKCTKKLSATGSIYIMAATQYMPHVDIYVASQMTILSRIVWHYDSSGVQARRYFGSMYEPIIFAVKDASNYTFNASAIEVPARTGAVRRLIDYRKPVPARYSSTKVPGNVWHFPMVRFRMPEYEEHPSQKPTALLERIVLGELQPRRLGSRPFRRHLHDRRGCASARATVDKY
jgi:site-specific DNA-methyltransferase (adenine-specific)